MLKLNLQQFAEAPAAEGAEGSTQATDTNVGTSTDATETSAGTATDNGEQKVNDESVESLKAEIERLRTEAAKNKKAVDDATKEAADYRKQLRAKMTSEEIKAKEEEDAKEATAKRVAELEKTLARVQTVKSVMGKLAVDEETAGNFADCLYGASDIDNALLLFQKTWQAREKALKLEYGKITGPGVGTDSNSPESRAIARAKELGKAKNATNEQTKKALDAYLR